MISAQIVESFQITGRGAVIVIDTTTELPVGRCLQATIHLPDGSRADYEAWKEWLLRRNKEPLETEGFLLVDATITQVPIGAWVTLHDGDT